MTISYLKVIPLLRVTILYFLTFLSGEGKNLVNQENPVVIIGAGLSGLTAGYYLKKWGIPFIIYEARNRLGGRVNTHYFPNGTFEEVGGKEINDGGTAERLRILAHEVSCSIREEKETYKVNTLTEDKLSPQNLFSLSQSLSPEILSPSCNFVSLGERLDAFLGKEDYFRILLETWISCYEGINTYEISDEKGKLVLTWLMKRIELGRYGINKGEKRHSVFFTKGGSDFVERLAKPLQDSIHLNMKLVTIKKQDGKAVLIFENGHQVIAPHVILSVPFPTLKTINIDSSLWPEALKHTSLETLKGGSNTKILIPIKGKKDDCPFALTSQFTAWWNYDRTVLTVYFGGKASQLSFKTKEQREMVFERVWSILNKIYPHLQHKDITAENCVFLNWSEESYSQGSYSFVRNGKEEDYELTCERFQQICRKIFEPLGDLIFFAGEHTSLTHPSTMEGAVESGERAAKMIAERLMRK
ncbi:MAG: FAD-dependent oxidoreductase [Candidatus Paracaedibacteraceae bacterium]|nr:FAD-dependent oxidoreductase [Candidatus Paracaedibacteraceae bacterium]